MKSVALALGVLLAACNVSASTPGHSSEEDLNAGRDAGSDAADASKPPACALASFDDEHMVVTCEVPPRGADGEPIACTDLGSGSYECELACVRLPARDAEACGAARAFSCPDEVPSDCRVTGDVACCL